MTDKFRNKYRIPSARLQDWDYRWNAAYFVTICTHGRECFFGDVVDGKMILSHIGVIADVFWNEIKNHTNHIELGAYQVMPNHVHGIVIIYNPIPKNKIIDNDINNLTGNGAPPVETLHATSLQPQQTQKTPQSLSSINNEKMSQISPESGSLSTIIHSYKSAVTKHANRLDFENGWQTRFHDHIICDGEEYKRIENYIINNPQNWDEDKFHPNNRETDDK